MQFSILAVFSLVAVAMAMPTTLVERDVSDKVLVQTAAMSDKDGNVVPFDSKNVYLAAKAAGL